MNIILLLLLSAVVAAQNSTLLTSSTTSTTLSTSSSSTTSTATSTSLTSTAPASTTSATSSSPSSLPPQSPPPQQHTTLQPVLTTISGSEVIVTLTSVSSPSSTSSSPSPSPSPPPPSQDSGLGTGSIVGLSVAGGVALLGVIAFFFWKYNNKRSSNFDDSEAIKWPDLNNHASGNQDSHPLPVKNTGRAGFDTASDTDLSSIPAHNYSTTDFPQDPYAVPPLPQFNPNQPYSDDPASLSLHYDPYSGPVQHPFDPSSAEAIPMNTLPGRVSPLPPQQQQYQQLYNPS